MPWMDVLSSMAVGRFWPPTAPPSWPERLFGISPREATFERRGFRADSPAAQARLEHVGATFLGGYAAALAEADTDSLARRLDEVELETRGFAYEGAAMAVALLAMLFPWRRSRLREFMRGPGDRHTYMVHVGVGWAVARVPLRFEFGAEGFDPLLRWLVFDGMGFHCGYFQPARHLGARLVPRRLDRGYQRRAFDQGLGRALWFVTGGAVRRLRSVVMAFPEARQDDLWAGVGLACAYAGGVDDADLSILVGAAGSQGLALAQGACFAAKARERAGNPSPHTERACRAWCGVGASEAAAVADAALAGLPVDRQGEAYEAWRQRIRARWTPRPGGSQ